jgi:hypothetical protein
MDRKQLILIAAICGGATALGVILPWATMDAPMSVGGSFNGFNTGWGTLVFLAALAAGAAALLIHLGKIGQFVKLTELQHVYVMVGGFGLATLGTLIHFFSGTYTTVSGMGHEYGWHRGIGLWICLLGTLGGEAVSFLVMKGASSPAPPSTPPKA